MRPDPSTIPYGTCHCGCGQITRIHDKDRPNLGYVKGEPRAFIHQHHKRQSPVDYLVEDRGYRTACWIWQGGTNRRGYGQSRYAGRGEEAHRAYYRKHVGQIPAGFDVDHLCRVPPCVNPDHLEAVTHAENLRRGNCAKLSSEDVIAIRRLLSAGVMQKTIAAQFGVSRCNISGICHHRTWKDVVA